MSDVVGATGDGGAPSADIQFRIAMDLSPIGFCLVATDGSFLRVNNALCELMGRDEQALKTATWQELTHPEDLEADQRLVDEVLAGHCDGYRIVKRYLRPDGSIVWGDLAVGCMRNTDGSVRYFISQIVDVTTMHDAHEALARAQEQTREQAEYLRAVIDSELDPRVLVTPHRDASGTVADLIYAEANARALTYFGRSADEIIGARMLELYPGQRTSGLFDGYVHTLQTGDPLIVNERELASDVSGEVRWIDLQAVRVDDTLSITWRDVSDRRRASEALAASEAHYRVLAQYSSDIVTECDHEGVSTWVSDSVTDRLGWSPSELVGRPIRRFVHRDDHVAVDQFASDLRDGEKRQLTARILTRDGDYRWFTVMVQPQLDADGHVVGRVSGWRYVHAEHEAQAEVQRSRTLYQLIAENAADVVLLMDSDGQITWLSPSIERLSGWPAEALTGNQAWRLAHPDDADKIRAVVAEVLESSGRAHVEARLRTRHGDYRWWHIAMRRTSTDIDAALVAALRDVNDEVVARKRAESESAKRIALLNSMFDPHVVLEAVRDETGDIVDFIYTDANDAACEYNRTGREELVGASLMQLLPGHRGSDLFAAYCHTVDTGEPLVLDDYVYPNEILTEPRHYDIRAVKVADSLSYTWRDVTDRSLLGEQLAESEERFRLIATNTSDIIGVADTHGTLEWVSPSITRALGWDPADMQGHGVYELVHPDDMARVLQGQSEVADGREGSVRARVRDRDGKYHWSEVRAAPIISEQGKVLGITAAVSIIDERVAWEQTLRHQASHDPLTGLLNREEIFRRLDSMLGHPPRTGIRTFLAFLDLDNLKRTNDEFGHAAGDELLRTVAQRTRSLLRDGDQIARIGGDELLVILPGMQDTDAAVHLAGRLLETVSAPHTFGAHTLRPRMSIGVAEVHTGDDIERAVHKADTAMYRAKAAGGNRIALAD